MPVKIFWAVLNTETGLHDTAMTDFLRPWSARGARLKVLYAQAALVVASDEGGFVASVVPGADVSRNETAGSVVRFAVNLSSTALSASGDGRVDLAFQGHKVCYLHSRKEQTMCSRISNPPLCCSGVQAVPLSRPSDRGELLIRLIDKQVP